MTITSRLSLIPRSSPRPTSPRNTRSRAALLRRRVLACLGLLVFACVPKTEVSVPQVTPSSTLSPAKLGAGQPGVFSLVFFGPQGPTTGDPAVQLVFSKPLRELGPDIPTPEGLALSPAVAGRWEWVGSHGLTFVPDKGRLPRATAFTVTVPAGLRSLEGESIGESRTFQFETPAPAVLRSSPNRWNRAETPDTELQFHFSQPVSPSALDGYLRVTSRGKALRVVLRRGDSPEHVIGRSPEGWPLASTIEFALSTGWRGQEGEVVARAPHSGQFETYGPLHATVECEQDPEGKCRPEGDVWLSLTNSVHARTLARAVRARGTSLQVDKDWGANDTTSRIALSARLVPGQRFKVVVDPVVDVFGQRLASVANAEVVVGDRRPTVAIGFSGDSLVGAAQRVAILSTNASYELVAAPLSPEVLQSLDAMDSDKRFEALAALPSKIGRQIPKGQKNQQRREFVDVGQLLGKTAGQGPFAIGVRYRGERGLQDAVRWGQRTDLGVTAKLGRKKSQVWVTRLGTGAPVVGAVVREVGQSASILTDSRGVAALADGQFISPHGYGRPPRWLEVSVGAERVYRSSDDSVGGWRLPVMSDFRGEDRELAQLFPERDLFRPGESFWLKGYLRRPAEVGNVVVVGESVELRLLAPDGEQVQKVSEKTNSFGAFAARLAFPRSGSLGQWTVQLWRGERELASVGLQLAEFRAAEFEVKVNANKPNVVADEQIRWSTNGQYFFGGVMANAPVDTTIVRQATWFSPPGHDEHITDDNAWQRFEREQGHSNLLSSEKRVLSKMGELSFETAAKLKGQVGPERLVLESTVHDLSGQALSGRQSVLVHPASFYLALERPQSLFVEAPARVAPRILAITPEGRPVSGRAITLSLYRIRWTYAKQGTSSNAATTISEPVRDFVGACDVMSAKEARSCELAVATSGEYLVRAQAVDERGHKAAASRFFYGIGGAGQAAWRDDDERGGIDVELDRSAYRVGQTARVLLKSPFERARAWITIERDGIISERTITVQGPAPVVEVPVEERFRPNAFVSIHLVEDRQALGKKAHDIGESYRIGYADLRVDPERQRLDVAVKADRKEYRPGGKVSLDFRVRDAAGRASRAEVTVFVVDEGVLTLSGYKLPDPLATYTQPRPLRVETIEGRESIAKLFGLEPSQHANKGDPGGGGDGARSVFLTTAYFNPSVVTDGSGKASVEFRLPENLGRFRVMALAVSADDRYGRGQGELTVNKNLMARPALPRFLRAGDRFDASVVVSSLGLPSGPVIVSAEAEGLELLDKASQTIELESHGSTLVRFAARAPVVGTANLRFRVAGGGATDATSLKREIQTPAQIETSALYGRTDTTDAHRLGNLSALRTDMGALDVTLSSTSMVGLEGGFVQLWDYPYLCTEQLSSRVLPLVALRDLAALMGVEVPADASTRIAAGCADIIRRQRGDGGFGMWPESTLSSPWISPYALWTLHQASARGVKVPASTFERGKRYLRDIAAKREVEQLPGAVFAAFVLGQIGSTDPSTLGALYEHLEQMPVFSQTLLLWASVDANLPQLIKPLKERVQGAVTLRGNAAEIAEPQGEDWGQYMASPIRLHALALRALLAAEPEHAMAAPLVRSLLAARKGGRWGNTQESAFVLLALDAYQKAQESVEPRFEARVFLDKAILGQRRFVGRDVTAREFSVPMARLSQGNDLVFQKEGAGKLFYEARLRYARSQLPTHPLESGFMVSKTMRAVTREQLAELPASGADANSAEHGQLVVVDLNVLAPTRRRFVVVDDPIPAGLEAIDFNLQTSSTELVQSEGGSAQAWFRQELRDDRVLYFIDEMPPGIYQYRYLARATTRGQFVVPPTRAMEMYQEEVYGRTASRQFIVQ